MSLYERHFTRKGRLQEETMGAPPVHRSGRLQKDFRQTLHSIHRSRFQWHHRRHLHHRTRKHLKIVYLQSMVIGVRVIKHAEKVHKQELEQLYSKQKMEVRLAQTP